jgi:hypothetical protein
MRLSDPVLRLTIVKRSASFDAKANTRRPPRPVSRPLAKGMETRDNPPAPAPAASARQRPSVASRRQPRPSQQIRKVLETSRDFRVNPIAPPPMASTHQVFPPQVKPRLQVAPRVGPLGRLIALLRGGAAAEKRLRLAETVALGEKRFVAIIDADGRKYLIGGGTSGVALLAPLDDSTKAEDLPQLRDAIEAAR